MGGRAGVCARERGGTGALARGGEGNAATPGGERCRLRAQRTMRSPHMRTDNILINALTIGVRR